MVGWEGGLEEDLRCQILLKDDAMTLEVHLEEAYDSSIKAPRHSHTPLATLGKLSHWVRWHLCDA